MKVTGVSTPTRAFAQNDDWLGSSPQMVVLLGGLGISDAVPDNIDTGCRHDVGWFVKTLGTSLLRNGEDARAPLDDVLSTAISETSSAHQRSCNLSNPLTPAASVVMIRANTPVVEYLVLAHATLILDDGGNEPMVINDDRMARVELPGHIDESNNDRHGNTAVERFNALARLRNHPDGFPVAAADSNAAYQATTGQIQLNRIKRALLASRGATRLVELFEQMSWTQLLDMASKSGPEEIIHRTREVEEADLKCLAWPRERIHEDATAALCVW